MSATTRLSLFLPALTLFSLLSAAVSAQILPPYTSVTDARLRNQDNDSWLLYRGSYDSHGYSALDQIDTDNVASLKAGVELFDRPSRRPSSAADRE
jgi:glucose dehydrogenase